LFYFLIPLRSAATTQNWALTCSLLGRTLRNLSGQRSKNWHIVLVHSDCPDIAELGSPNITTCHMDLPVPGDRAGRRRDKRLRLAAGVEAIFERAAGESDTVIMPMDADDLLSVRLVEFGESAEADNGFVVSRGYLHHPASRLLYTHNRFHTLCGSCEAFRIRRGNRVMFGAPGELIDLFKKHGHGGRPLAMSERGTPLTGVPFRGAVYSLSTGDNHSGNRLGLRWKPWRMVPVSLGLRNEFPGLAG
jgi:hypothetical protein